MTTEAELVAQLRALGIPDWDTARWLMDEAAKRIESQAAEIERLKSTPPDQREDLRCVIADLMRQCQESDALLRQALVLLRGPAPNGYGVGSEQEAVIAAIKQHLGEARLA